MSKKTQYEGDVVMFLLNKIIKNVGLANGFKITNHVHGFKTMHMVFMHMVYGFKTMCKSYKTTRSFIVHGLVGPYTWF